MVLGIAGISLRNGAVTGRFRKASVRHAPLRLLCLPLRLPRCVLHGPQARERPGFHHAVRARRTRPQDHRPCDRELPEGIRPRRRRSSAPCGRSIPSSSASTHARSMRRTSPPAGRSSCSRRSTPTGTARSTSTRRASSLSPEVTHSS